MLKRVYERLFQNKFALLVIILGTISWSLVMVRSGMTSYWGPNGHDGIWHVSLARSLARGSWEMPTYAGQVLKNYHLGFDLLLAFLSRVTGISTFVLYFQILPPLFAFSVGILVYYLVNIWRKDRVAAVWAVFFTYFGGSWGWLVSLIKDKSWGGESMFWSQQAISTLINPPLSLSLILMVLGVILLFKNYPKGKWYWLVTAALIFGILIQVKAYAGALSLGALWLAGIYELLRKKKLVLLAVAFLATLIGLLVFLPFNKTSAGLLVFKPFWFLETMMGLTDRLGWLKYGQAMVDYRSGGVWYKAVPAYLIALLIFWYGNMGTRFIQEFLLARWLVRFKKRFGFVEIFLASIVFAGCLIPLFFLQAGTPWNTIQFFYYSLFFSGILAGISWASLLSIFQQKKALVLSLVVVLMTLPTTIVTLKTNYLTIKPPAKVSQEELTALTFLEKQPMGIVLTYNFDRVKSQAALAQAPRPLYLYESTAYVSAYGNKPVYLEDEVNLDITQYDWQQRREKVANFVTSQDVDTARTFLREEKITYLYLVKALSPLPGERLKLGESQLALTTIFENGEVVIYKVN